MDTIRQLGFHHIQTCTKFSVEEQLAWCCIGICMLSSAIRQ